MTEYRDLDVVELTRTIDRWPAGTTGTIVDDFPAGVVLELVGPAGETLDMLDVSLDCVRPAPGGRRVAHAV